MEDQILVHIIHGSLRKILFLWEPHDLLSQYGHVALQINDRVYGFYYRDVKKLHIFPHKKKKNCLFQDQSLQEWNDVIAGKKVTTVTIPVTTDEKTGLLNFYKQNIEEPGYDYSFFGERCASSCYHLLKEINKIGGGHYYFNAFYPEQLRKRLIREARRKNYAVSVKEAS